jgi:hypothetical protein
MSILNAMETKSIAPIIFLVKSIFDTNVYRVFRNCIDEYHKIANRLKSNSAKGEKRTFG